MAGAFLDRCLLLDLETRGRDEILRLGAVLGDRTLERRGGERLAGALEALERLARPAELVLGHNLLGHDLQVLRALAPSLALLRKPVVDTLYLSPLAFPENPYHHLVKDYKLVRSSVNDPVATPGSPPGSSATSGGASPKPPRPNPNSWPSTSSAWATTTSAAAWLPSLARSPDKRRWGRTRRRRTSGRALPRRPAVRPWRRWRASSPTRRSGRPGPTAPPGCGSPAATRSCRPGSGSAIPTRCASAAVRRNLREAAMDVADLRIQPDEFGGWRMALVSEGFRGRSTATRKQIALKGLEEVDFEWLDLLTPEEKEWAGALPSDSALETLPLWPEALARGGAPLEQPVFPSDLDEDLPPPIVATYYSLRGGVGRSSALAYAAQVLASRGRKVVCIDMDVEAPGLAALFGREADVAADQGTVELLIRIDQGEEPDISQHLLPLSTADDL